MVKENMRNIRRYLADIKGKEKYILILFSLIYLTSLNVTASDSESGFGNFLDKALNAAERYADKKSPHPSQSPDNRYPDQFSQGQREQYYMNQYPSNTPYSSNPNSPYVNPYYQGQTSPYPNQLAPGYNQQVQPGNTQNLNPSMGQPPFGYPQPLPQQYGSAAPQFPQGYPLSPQTPNNQVDPYTGQPLASYPPQSLQGQYNSYGATFSPGYSGFPNQPQCQCSTGMNNQPMRNPQVRQTISTQGYSSYSSSLDRNRNSRGYDRDSRDQTDRMIDDDRGQQNLEDYIDGLDE